LSWAQYLDVRRMLARIGAGNVPEDGWQVTDGMFPSIVVSHVDKLVPTPKAPAGFWGAYMAGVALNYQFMVMVNRTRDLVVHQLTPRHLWGFTWETARAAICEANIVDGHGLTQIPLGGTGQRFYPIYTGGAPPTTECWVAYHLQEPVTNNWGGGLPARFSWSDIGRNTGAAQGVGYALRDLDWLVQVGYALLLWIDVVATPWFCGVDWHEQPPGAHSGSMTAFP
jgi:hypothetical protein